MRVPRDPYWRRKATDAILRGLCVLCVAVAVLPLLSVLGYIAGQGLSGINLAFFTQLPLPVGESGGGMANAILGTLTLVGLGCAVGIPCGVLGGVFLAEFGHGRFARVVHFAADVLSGMPSIILGLFVYTVVVLPMHRFSALAGGVALGLLMLPTVMRTTEELVRLVPDSLREAALALGVPRWRAILRIVIRTAAPGITTGIMLAVARVAGETAPLLFTAFNNRFFGAGLDQPVSSLPVQIFTYAVSPYEDWHQKAWSAALVLVSLVLFLNIAARVLVRRREQAR